MPYNVMIVDDAAMMRLYIASFIKTLPDFKVVAQAANGQEALDKLSTVPDVDLILLDIEMPVMDGLEFLRLRDEVETKVLSALPDLADVILDTLPSVEEEQLTFRNKAEEESETFPSLDELGL